MKDRSKTILAVIRNYFFDVVPYSVLVREGALYMQVQLRVQYKIHYTPLDVY